MFKSENIKIFIKKEWMILILLIVSFIGGAYFYPSLPRMLPSHWGFNGQVDGYSSKELIAFGFPAIALAMYVMMLIIPLIDPKKKNYDLFKGAYYVIRTIIVVFFLLMFWCIIIFGLGYKINIEKIVVISIGVLFMILGNYMGRIRQNYFVGIKTPWTLNNEEIWTKTHRLAGKLWVIAGLVMIITIFINSVLTFSIMIALMLYPVFYSYLLHVKMQKKETK